MQVSNEGAVEFNNTITRSLKYEFTASEIHDLSLNLANEVQDMALVEAEKKSASAGYKGKIDNHKKSISDLSAKISTGCEYRDVECEVIYHKPENGKKTIIRGDNGKVIVEKMTPEDNNLFNQQFD
ncbi:MAG: hypothetical protein J7599_07630 [Niabella sp.]|nr:hypothetical protein [Niabella sp.]